MDTLFTLLLITKITCQGGSGDCAEGFTSTQFSPPIQRAQCAASVKSLPNEIIARCIPLPPTPSTTKKK